MRTPEGHPIRDATVTARKRDGEGRVVVDVRSGPRGDYRFAELLDGVWEVEAVARGRLSVRYTPVHVLYPYPTELNIVLPLRNDSEAEPPAMLDALVVGRLVNRRGGGVGKAEVCFVTMALGLPKRCTVTNGLGQYSLPVALGHHEVTVRVAGVAVFTRDFVIKQTGIAQDPIPNPLVLPGVEPEIR